MEAEEHSGQAGQPRVIGTMGALAIVVGSMLGIGIFLTPSQVASHLPSALGYLAVWVVGGLIAFSGAVAYAELGTRFPRAGGDYVFLREAFGPSVSFAAGWVLFIGVFTGSVATMAVPLAQYQLPVLLGPAVSFDPGQVLLSFGVIEVTWARAIGVLLILVLTGLNVLGTRLSAGTQVLLTVVPVLLFGLAAVLIFFLAEGAPPPAAAAELSEPVIGFGRAILAIYFAYAGWNAIAYVGGELKDPGRTVPRSLLGGTVIITLLYLIMAGAFLFVLGIDGLPQAFEAGTATAQALGGGWVAYGVTLIIALALLGSLNATILAGGRVGWAMARAGALSASVGRLHPRFATPHRTLALQAAVALALVLTGTFELLLELTSVAMLLMGALTMIALFVIRRRDGREAPYQATLYPWLPLFYLLVSAVVIGAGLYRAVAGSDGWTLKSFYPLMGLAIFALTWALHRFVFVSHGPKA